MRSMLDPSSLVLKANMDLTISNKEESYHQLWRLIDTFMIDNGYERLGYLPEYNIPSREYILHQNRIKGLPISLKIKKAVGLLDKEEENLYYYRREVLSKRDEFPFDVRIMVNLREINPEVTKVKITVVVKPALYFKITQFGYKRIISPELRNMVVQECHEFLLSFAHAINAEIRELSTLSVVKDETLRLLEDVGLKEIRDLLEESRKNINSGKHDDAVLKLRQSLERCLTRLLEMKGESTSSHFSQNLKRVCALLGFNKKCICQEILQNIYNTLSQQIHGRTNQFTKFEYMLMWDVSCSTMKYLTEKLLVYNITSPQNNVDHARDKNAEP